MDIRIRNKRILNFLLIVLSTGVIIKFEREKDWIWVILDSFFLLFSAISLYESFYKKK